MPLFSTPTQFLALLLVLLAGWLLGLASHSGGRKWRDRYTAEREAHAANRRTADSQRAADKARIAELEQDNSRLARSAPVVPTTPIAPVTPVAVARTAATPAYPAGQKRGWFDWDTRPTRA